METGMDVRTLSLGMLTHGPMTGYEIKKCLEENFRHIVSAGYGSIYPALAELAAEGLVAVTEIEQERRPDKKVYRLTPSGRERLMADLLETKARHRVRSEFLVLMYFAHLLPHAKVEEAIDTIVSQWERWLYEDLEHYEAQQSGVAGEPMTPGMRFAVGYGRTVLTAALAYVKRQRGTLLRELEAEGARSGSQPRDAARQSAAE
jgi:PadR family transcriptional regulator AphA